MATQSRGSDAESHQQALAHAFAAFGPAYKRWVKAQMADHELKYTHSRALHLLWCKGPVMMSGLGDDLGITPRYVTILVDHLEDAGLVRRCRHPKDRRATLVELTPQGRTACAQAGDEHVEAAARLLQVLEPDQQRALLAAMCTLLGELQRRGYGPDPETMGIAPERNDLSDTSDPAGPHEPA